MSFQSRTKSATPRIFVVGTLVVLAFVSYSLFAGGLLFAPYAELVGTSSRTWDGIERTLESKAALEQKNKQLQGKLDAQDAALVLAEVNAENYRQLRQSVLGEGEGVSARVVVRPPYAAYDQYVLALASSSPRVARNSLVVADASYAVGYVSRVHNQYALAQLFSQAGHEIAVSIGGVLYKAEGIGGGNLEVKLPRSYRDESGNIASLPGSGYIVGTLADTQFDPQDSFVRGIISLPINIYTQELVSVSTQTYEPVEEILNNFDADSPAD